MKIILIHGNGGCTADMHWYFYVEKELTARGYRVVRKTLPDNQVAHESIWIPYIRDVLEAGQEDVLVGHSSGAIAAMRFAEQYSLAGMVLVSAYISDLGNENEKAGGWFDRPWQWEKICNHLPWVIQFASVDDPWIPIDEARWVRSHLKSEYYEYSDRGHFTGEPDTTEFPELVEALDRKLSNRP
ncbi:RBBP9/YdeN family alpha/beta hydrolase [Endozoicomonas numazuensis]|uniref:RBBP9/YdeN family alpha/beta hydrolase n=1 Tax=Endozoicomonas numazuensis TaxID=1137799 RepID=UPI00054FFD17|nr:alpha/beta fold hydrolase [Endozoicomonas numazuensis]